MTFFTWFSKVGWIRNVNPDLIRFFFRDTFTFRLHFFLNLIWQKKNSIQLRFNPLFIQSRFNPHLFNSDSTQFYSTQIQPAFIQLRFNPLFIQIRFNSVLFSSHKIGRKVYFIQGGCNNKKVRKVILSLFRNPLDRASIRVNKTQRHFETACIYQYIPILLMIGTHTLFIKS